MEVKSPMKLYQYHSHKSWEEKGIQTEDCGLPPLQFSKKDLSNQTPVKLQSPTTSTEKVLAPALVLTGKSGNSPVITNEKRRSSGVVNCPGKKVNHGYQCKECGIIYESDEDTLFREIRKRKTTWIGCDQHRCDYWAHASCANLQFKPRVPVDEHAFLCPKHKKKRDR